MHLGIFILLSVVSLPFSSASVLTEILSIRSPLHPWTDCHFVLHGPPPPLLLLDLLDLPGYTTLELLANETSAAKSFQTFKRSPTCVHFLVSLTSPLPPADRQWLRHHSLNMKQETVHFLFVGLESLLLPTMSSKTVEAIKYATAFAYDTQTVILKSNQKILKFPISVPSPQLPSDAALMLERTINIGSWTMLPLTLVDEANKPIGGAAHSYASVATDHYNLSVSIDVAIKSVRQLPNGSWEGFMRDLTEGDCDVLTTLIPSLHRLPHIEFTTTTFPLEGKFYTAHPRVTVNWLAILQIFSIQLWLAVIGVSLVVSVLLHLSTPPSQQDMYVALMFPVCMILGQGLDMPSRAKFLASVYIFFATIVNVSYNSDFIGYLTLPSPERIPRTFAELADDQRFKIELQYIPGVIMQKFFKETNVPQIVKLRPRIQFEPDFLKCVEHAAFREKTACIGYGSNVETWVAKNLTLKSSWYPLVQSQDISITMLTAMALPKLSKHYRFWNTISGRLRDTGHMDQFFQDALSVAYKRSRPWIHENLKDETDLSKNLVTAFAQAEDDPVKPLSLEHFSLANLILAIGLCCSSLAFCSERIVAWRKMNLERNTNLTNFIAESIVSNWILRRVNNKTYSDQNNAIPDFEVPLSAESRSKEPDPSV